jgi:hypothetical protein
VINVLLQGKERYLKQEGLLPEGVANLLLYLPDPEVTEQILVS